MTDTDVAAPPRQPAAASPPAGGGAPSLRWRCLHVATLWVPLAALTVGSKIFKLKRLVPDASASDALSVLGSDLLFLSFGFLAFVTWLGARRVGQRQAARIVFHVLTPAVFAITVGDHAFFDISGAICDWYIFKDGMARFAALADLYRSQLTVQRAVGLAATPLLSIVVWGTERLLAHRKAQASNAAGFGRLRWTLLGLAAVGLLGSAIAPPAAATGLARNVIIGMVSDMGDDLIWSGLQERTAVPSEQRGLIGPQSLTRKGEGHAQNLILIALESVGAKYTTPYSDYDTTPFLDDLRSRGALVERAYTVMPHTSKALVAMHCGIYPKLTPSVDEAKTHGIPARCLPRLLGEHGYDTAFFQPAEESYEQRANLVRELGFKHFAGKESLDGSNFDESNYFGWEDDVMLQPIVHWLEQRGGTPFMLSVLTLTSHHPYAIPKGYEAKRYAPERELNDYLNTVAYTDRFVGRLYAKLVELGLQENTAIFVMGDHGEGFGQHGVRQHDPVVYEEGVHIPLLLSSPGVEPGSRIKGLRQLIDVAPTAVGLLGLQPDRPFFGRDMLQEEGHERLLINCFYRRYCMAMIGETTKFVYHFDRRAAQIFDLVNDPLEKHDLYPERSAELNGALERAVAEMHLRVSSTNATYERVARTRLSQFVRRAPFDDVGIPMDVAFGDFVKLVGVKLEPATFEVGGRSTVTMYYQVLRDAPSGWRAFMHVEGPDRINSDHVPVEGAYPVSDWKVGDYIEDRFVVGTRPSVAPGDYGLLVGFWNPETTKRMPISGPKDIVTNDQRARVGDLHITYPEVDTAEYVSESETGNSRADVRFGEILRLYDAAIDKPMSKAGLKFTATMYFHVLQDLGDHYEMAVEMRGPRQRSQKHYPVYGQWPLAKWKKGQFIRDPHDVVTHTRDPLGGYSLWLSLRDTRTGQRVPVSGTGLSIADDAVCIGEVKLTR